MNTNPFHISAEATQELLNDYQHTVERRIELNGHKADFPQMERYHVTRDELSDYLFDRQAIIDSRGSERSRYTVAGILIMLPILVLALLYPVNEMPLGDWSIIVAALIGVVLWGIVMLVQKLIIAMRIRRLERQYPAVKDYVEAVLNF